MKICRGGKELNKSNPFVSLLFARQFGRGHTIDGYIMPACESNFLCRSSQKATVAKTILVGYIARPRSRAYLVTMDREKLTTRYLSRTFEQQLLAHRSTHKFVHLCLTQHFDILLLYCCGLLILGHFLNVLCLTFQLTPNIFYFDFTVRPKCNVTLFVNYISSRKLTQLLCHCLIYIYTDGDIDRGQLILGLETALKQLRELEAAVQYSTLSYGAVQRYNTRNKCNCISATQTTVWYYKPLLL